MTDIDDPRQFAAPDEAPVDAAEAYRLAAASLGATTGQDAQAADAALDAGIDALLREADTQGAGRRLAAWLAGAPSTAVYRHVWRALVRRTAAPAEAGAGVQLFAIPLVIVAGVPEAGGPVALPGAIADVDALAGLLVEHGALAGNRSFALADALAAADALDCAALPGLLAARRKVLAEGEPLAIAPAPLLLPAGETVHLRFVVGSAIVGEGGDVTSDAGTGRWGLPVTRLLSAQWGVREATLLVLPRPVASPLAAVAQGRAAQRDASAQLFASNALRQLRASFGEPAAVISAHRAADAPGGGELRLSLSAPFSPRDAYGFRCPILPHERAADAALMLADLLRDARVADVHVVAGVHDDRDPVTGGPLLFKPSTLPPSSPVH